MRLIPLLAVALGSTVGLISCTGSNPGGLSHGDGGGQKVAANPNAVQTQQAVWDSPDLAGGLAIAPDRADDPAVLHQLSQTFKSTKPLALVEVDGQIVFQGLEDYQTRYACFIGLLNGYFFVNDHLSGMSREQVDEVFGPGSPCPGSSTGSDRYMWEAGPDVLIMEFRNNRAVVAGYISGQ